MENYNQCNEFYLSTINWTYPLILLLHRFWRRIFMTIPILILNPSHTQSIMISLCFWINMCRINCFIVMHFLLFMFLRFFTLRMRSILSSLNLFLSLFLQISKFLKKYSQHIHFWLSLYLFSFKTLKIIQDFFHLIN